MYVFFFNVLHVSEASKEISLSFPCSKNLWWETSWGSNEVCQRPSRGYKHIALFN